METVEQFSECINTFIKSAAFTISHNLYNCVTLNGRKINFPLKLQIFYLFLKLFNCWRSFAIICLFFQLYLQQIIIIILYFAIYNLHEIN